jgi:hypothetical protein
MRDWSEWDKARLGELNDAIAEAERFLRKAKALRREWEARKHTYSNGVERAAATRSSMDLTRALAMFRKRGLVRR